MVFTQPDDDGNCGYERGTLTELGGGGGVTVLAIRK
jgi:hypothetical protein